MKKRLESMEMWCYRRMMKIPWTDMVKNEDVLERVKEQRQIIKRITEKQMRFLGHIAREDNLEKLVLDGKIDGSRSRG